MPAQTGFYAVARRKIGALPNGPDARLHPTRHTRSGLREPKSAIAPSAAGAATGGQRVAVTDKDQLKEVVRKVVLAQGNIFIKELLREHGGPLGSTKQEFLDNLERAIDEERITGPILRAWLAQVEGWGEQSVYLYTVPRALRNRAEWRNPELLRAALGAAGFPSVWDADSSPEYPDSLKLTAVRMCGAVLTFEWHRAWEKLIRLGEHRDKKEVVGNDRIYYKAYLKTGRRAVVRFQIRPDDRLAAAFLQVPATSPEHA